MFRCAVKRCWAESDCDSGIACQEKIGSISFESEGNRYLRFCQSRPFDPTADKIIPPENSCHSSKEITLGMGLQDVSLRPGAQGGSYDGVLADLSEEDYFCAGSDLADAF